MSHLYIIGFKASGKTTYGQQLAHELGKSFIDLDWEIEKSEGRSIGVLYRDLGEEKFRFLEHRVLCEIAQLNDHVVSLGGGVVCYSDSLRVLRKSGRILFLNTPIEVMVERLKGKQYLGSDASEVRVREEYSRRVKNYRTWADEVLLSC